MGVKLSPGRREVVEEDVFKVWLYFSLFYTALIGNKLNKYPHVESVLPMMVTMSDLSLSLF